MLCNPLGDGLFFCETSHLTEKQKQNRTLPRARETESLQICERVDNNVLL